MSSDKLKLIKKIIAKQLDSFDFDKEINRHEDMLSEKLKTPADEFSFSGNIEQGITNILNNVTSVSYPIGFLNAQKLTLENLLSLLDKEEHQLEEILNPKPIENDVSWKDDLLERCKSKEKSDQKHFFDCELTDEDWGSENCICPGAYIYRKYLSIGLSEEEAKLISDYTELKDLMLDKGELAKAKELYEKHKFLNISIRD